MRVLFFLLFAGAAHPDRPRLLLAHQPRFVARPPTRIGPPPEITKIVLVSA